MYVVSIRGVPQHVAQPLHLKHAAAVRLCARGQACVCKYVCVGASYSTFPEQTLLVALRISRKISVLALWEWSGFFLYASSVYGSVEFVSTSACEVAKSRVQQPRQNRLPDCGFFFCGRLEGPPRYTNRCPEQLMPGTVDALYC